MLTIKALDERHALVAGYGVVFGGNDLEGDTFTAATDFAPDLVPHKPVFYDHAQGDLPDAIGVVRSVKQDERGLWVEAQLDRARAYVNDVLALVQRGVLGWSSGSVEHLIRRADGTITHWPLVEFSLTPTPCEPRTLGVRHLKARGIVLPPAAAPATRIEVTDTRKGTTPMTTLPNDATTHDAQTFAGQIAALNAQMQQLLQYAEEAPAIRRAGYVSPDGGTADRGIKTFGDFLVAVSRHDTKRLRDVYGSNKRLEEATGASGGFLVPQQFVARLMQVAAERAVVRPRAFVLPMSSKDATIPALDHSGDYVEGNSALLGGLAMQWIAEGATVPTTEPTFRRLVLTAHKMSGQLPVSNELLADNATGLEALLVRLFGAAVAFAEDYAFLRGDGSSKPQGVLGAACTITSDTAITPTGVTVPELTAMYKRLLPPCRATAVWVIHPLLSDALLAMNSTGNNVLTYLPNVQGRIEPRLFGLPVLETEKLPPTFADGGLLLADFQQYVVGARQQIELARSEHVNFGTDETVWRVTTRVEGQPWLNAPVKLGAGAGDTASAFVRSQ